MEQPSMVADYLLLALAPDPSLVELERASDQQWAGDVFSVEVMDVELADGSFARREVVRHHGGAGVVALLEKKICLVRQYRVAQRRITLEIPAGKIESEETGRMCAARELKEETGLVAGRLEPLACLLGSPGFTDEHTEVFLALDIVQSAPSPDEGENLRVLWADLDDVLVAIEAGVIQDAKTVAGALAVRARGLA